MKLLFIEDEPDVIASAIRRLGELGHDCTTEEFGNTRRTLNDFRPDIVVLDILRGGSTPDHDQAGIGSFESIWNDHFCPVIVHSAHPELLSDEQDEHPFVKYVKKGRNSIDKIVESVTKFRPHVESFREAKKIAGNAFSSALRDVAPHAYRSVENQAERDDIVLRGAQRRLAVLSDESSWPGTLGDCLAPWEHYICPPICDGIFLGDVIREADGDSTNPTAFRLVLTPSCDLASADGRSPKVERILVSRCCPMNVVVDKLGIKVNDNVFGDESKLQKLQNNLTGKILSQGYCKEYVPLPALFGQIPTMAANLRDLDFVTFESIQNGHFLQVASIDSPFRELVAWAYMQIACRPGLPSRDFNKWSAEIVSFLESLRSTEVNNESS